MSKLEFFVALALVALAQAGKGESEGSISFFAYSYGSSQTSASNKLLLCLHKTLSPNLLSTLTDCNPLHRPSLRLCQITDETAYRLFAHQPLLTPRMILGIQIRPRSEAVGSLAIVALMEQGESQMVPHQVWQALECRRIGGGNRSRSRSAF